MDKLNKIVIISILIVFTIVNYITFPRNEFDYNFDDFDEQQDDFELVAGFLQDYYASLGIEEAVSFLIIDNRIIYNNKTVSYKGLETSIKTVNSNCLYWARVGKDYVYFHNGETPEYMLLWAEKPKAVLKELGIEDYRKLNRHWYDISQYKSIIG